VQTETYVFPETILTVIQRRWVESVKDNVIREQGSCLMTPEGALESIRVEIFPVVLLRSSGR
jgi:hypothetical protein